MPSLLDLKYVTCVYRRHVTLLLELFLLHTLLAILKFLNSPINFADRARKEKQGLKSKSYNVTLSSAHICAGPELLKLDKMHRKSLSISRLSALANRYITFGRYILPFES
jgi:hypothetical protein